MIEHIEASRETRPSVITGHDDPLRELDSSSKGDQWSLRCSDNESEQEDTLREVRPDYLRYAVALGYCQAGVGDLRSPIQPHDEKGTLSYNAADCSGLRPLEGSLKLNSSKDSSTKTTGTLGFKQACKLYYQHEYNIRIYKSIYDRDSRLEAHWFHIDFEYPKGRVRFHMECCKNAVCLKWFRSFYDAIFELREGTWDDVVSLAGVHRLVLVYDGDDIDEHSGRDSVMSISVIPKGFDSDAVRIILSATRY